MQTASQENGRFKTNQPDFTHGFRMCMVTIIKERSTFQVSEQSIFALFAEGFENRNTTWICATIHYVNFLDFQLNYKKLFCIGNTSKYWCIQMTKERKIVTQEFFLFPFFRFLTTWYFVLRVCLFSRKVRGSAGNEGKWIFVFVGVKWQAKTLLQGSSKVLCKKKGKE